MKSFGQFVLTLQLNGLDPKHFLCKHVRGTRERRLFTGMLTMLTTFHEILNDFLIFLVWHQLQTLSFCWHLYKSYCILSNTNLWCYLYSVSVIVTVHVHVEVTTRQLHVFSTGAWVFAHKYARYLCICKLRLF